jgi:hypothetical protein
LVRDLDEKESCSECHLLYNIDRNNPGVGFPFGTN